MLYRFHYNICFQQTLKHLFLMKKILTISCFQSNIIFQQLLKYNILMKK